MSTNYYAKWKIGDSLAHGVTVALHIGKVSNGRMDTMCGKVFPTRAAWRQFLTHNENNLIVVDEYNVEISVTKFIKTWLSYPIDVNNNIQYKWLRDHGYAVEDEPKPWGADRVWEGRDWLDEEGQLFHSGDFA